MPDGSSWAVWMATQSASWGCIPVPIKGPPTLPLAAQPALAMVPFLPGCCSGGATAQPQAEAKANALWSLFYGLTSADMDGAAVAYTDPGSAPVPLGRGPDGVFEYVVNLRITYKKE